MKRLALAALFLMSACSGSGGGTPPVRPSPTAPPGPSLANVTQISADPFTNASSQHATEVEPSAASNGTTIVAAFQMGRFFDFGASDLGFATSFDGGNTWRTGALPGATRYSNPAGPYDSISDPTVAYDARHAAWLISGIPILNGGNGDVPGVVVSTSTDGLTWSAPQGLTAADETTNDKSWMACDNHGTSAFYGNCYVEWDSFSGNGKTFMSTSRDGGHTWSAPVEPPESTGGFSGQIVVQPNGTAIVVIDDINAQNVRAFASHDGGNTWSASSPIATIADHAVAADFRTLSIPSAAADSTGKVYAVWQDCRFRANCSQNDLVLSTSADGVSWTAPARIPADALTSTVDHFILGLAVDPSTSGARAHLAVTYYTYANAACTAATCALSANIIASNDGGATWGAPALLAGPMNVSWLAQTLDGPMVGDYIATVFSGGRPIGVSAAANPLRGTVFDEAMYVPKPGVIAMQSLVRRSSAGERPVPGFHSDHPPRHLHP